MSRNKQVRFLISNENYQNLKKISPLKEQMSFNLDMILREYFKKLNREEINER